MMVTAAFAAPAVGRVTAPVSGIRSDATLVERCRRGDLSAYDQLYRLYGGRMKSIARNLLGSREDAEDAVQETFLKVYRAIDTFELQATFSTWLFRILVNTCRDAGRARKRRPDLVAPDFDLFPGQRQTPALALALERALARLTPSLREVFLLADSEGFTHTEIGSILSISEGASRSRLCEARRQLREELRPGTEKL